MACNAMSRMENRDGKSLINIKWLICRWSKLVVYAAIIWFVAAIQLNERKIGKCSNFMHIVNDSNAIRKNSPALRPFIISFHWQKFPSRHPQSVMTLLTSDSKFGLAVYAVRCAWDFLIRIPSFVCSLSWPRLHSSLRKLWWNIANWIHLCSDNSESET